MRSFTDEMEARVVSKRGPYDLFTGERNKPISVGYFALPVSFLKGDLQYKADTSFVKRTLDPKLIFV